MKKVVKTVRKNLYGFFLEVSALVLLTSMFHPLVSWLMESGYR